MEVVRTFTPTNVVRTEIEEKAPAQKSDEEESVSNADTVVAVDAFADALEAAHLQEAGRIDISDFIAEAVENQPPPGAAPAAPPQQTPPALIGPAPPFRRDPEPPQKREINPGLRVMGFLAGGFGGVGSAIACAFGAVAGSAAATSAGAIGLPVCLGPTAYLGKFTRDSAPDLPAA